MTLDTKEEIRSEFNNLLEIIGRKPTSTVKWKNIKPYARIYQDWKELQIDESKWDNGGKNYKMMILIHELSHVTDNTERNAGNHKLSFWKDYIRNYDKIKENKHKLNNSYNWDKIARKIVKDVLPENIDRRQTTVGELRGRIENTLGIKVDDRYSRSKYSAKFDELDDISAAFNYTDSTVYFEEMFDYGPDNIKWGKKLSPEKLWKKFKEVRTEDHSISGSGKLSYWNIPVPSIEEDLSKRSHGKGEKGSVTVTPCTRKDAILLQIAAQKTTRIGVDTGCE